MKEFALSVYRWIRLLRFKKKWRKKNKNNFTTADCIFNINKVFVGNGTYGNLYIRTFGNPNEYVSIGNYCSIADGVKIISGGNHCLDSISSFPFSSYYGNDEIKALTNGNIIIDDDVWLCTNAVILSGVHIGKGAVVAAGAIVTKDIPPYAIVGGVPARIIKYRFSEEIITRLCNEIDYSKLTPDLIKSKMDILTKPLDFDSISDINDILHN